VSDFRKPQEALYRVESKPGRFWYPRRCGHLSRELPANPAEECPHCASNLEGEHQERLLEVELGNVNYAIRLARARRNARLGHEPPPDGLCTI
jgi:hypothetical protein